MPNFSALSVGVKLALGAITLAIIGFALWFTLLRPQQATREAATAKTGAIVSDAATGAATDTLHIVVDRQAAEVRIIKTTEENTREIMAQSGALTPVDPAVHAAGLRAICVHDNASQPVCAGVLHDDGRGD